MEDEAAQHALDVKAHEEMYSGVMRASGEIGTPFALALTVFFTNLVLASGVLFALIAGIVTYVVVYLIIKMFFSH